MFNFINLITESFAKIILVILGQKLNLSPLSRFISILEKETIVVLPFW